MTLRRFAVAIAVSIAPLLSSPCARADVPSLGPQFNVSPLDYDPNLGRDTAPSVATNGRDFLVAWNEWPTNATTPTVVCARFTAAGVLLDRDATLLGLQPGTPSALWDGTKYLVVSSQSARRIDPTTGALDAPFSWGTYVDPWPAPPIPYVQAWGGGVLLQVEGTGSYASANFLDAQGKRIAVQFPPAGDTFAVGYSNGTFLVAWTNGGVVEGQRFSTTGALEDAKPIVIDPGHPSAPGADGGSSGGNAKTSSLQIAGSPSGFLTTWTDQRNGSEDVYAAQIGTDGTVMGAGGLLVATNSIDGQPTATWTGADWWVAWNGGAGSSEAVQGTTLETNGAVGAVQTIGPVGSNYLAAPPSLAATPATFFAAWETGAGNILGERFDTSWAPLDGAGASVSSHLMPQGAMTLAASDGGYLVGWTEGSAGLAMRLAIDGTRIDTAPIAVFQGTGDAKGLYAGMAGGAYAVAYANQLTKPFGIQVATLAAGASAFTPLAFQATNTGGFAFAPLAFACMADRCVVVWLDNNAANTYPVYAEVVMADGTVIPEVALGSAYQAVAGTDGSSFLVITNYGAMVPIAADGTAGAPLPTKEQSGPLAWGVDRYLLLSWGTTSNTLERLTSGGALIGAQEPAPPFAQTYLSAMAGWDGRSFLVFQDQTGAEVPAIAPSSNLATFALFASARAESLASAAPGTALLLGSEPQGGIGSPRAVVRMMGPPTQPDAGPSPDGGEEAGPDASGSDANGDVGHDASEGADGQDGADGADGADVADGGTDAAPGDTGSGIEDGAAYDGATNEDGGGDSGPGEEGGRDGGGLADGSTGPSMFDGAVAVADGSTPDVGTGADVGETSPTGNSEGGGCGCATAGASSPGSPFAGLLAVGAAIVCGRRLRKTQAVSV
jgi:hypothetical protein